MTESRGTAASRGYDSKWQKARASFLAKHPLCADHEARGQTVPATVVDHKVPHQGDWNLFWDQANWQALCKFCHDSHKRRLERSGDVVGCDEHGIPLDARHHWRTLGEGG